MAQIWMQIPVKVAQFLLTVNNLTKLLANEAVKSYVGRHEPEILTHLELVVNTVSMEEAVQQQAQTTEAAP